VRVLAVAQVHHLHEAAVGLRGERAAHRDLAAGVGHRGEIVADRRVVLRHAVEGGHRQREALGGRELAVVGLQFGQQFGVLVGRGRHRHSREVLGGAAQHRRAADVDVLHGILELAVSVGGDRFERIQVQHQQVDRGDPVLGHHRVIGSGAAEQAAMHQRMQRLDPAIHHFRKAGELGDIPDRQAGLADRLGGAAGGEQLDVAGGQCLGQVDQAGLVGNGQQRPAHGQEISGHGDQEMAKRAA
jgi:hypothetical protein